MASCSFKTIFTATLLASAHLVAGHGAIISATGDAGGQGMALGIDTSTPRDGTRRRPFQQDSTRFRGDQADTFGETIGAGDNDLESGTRAIMAEMGDQLPQVTRGGQVDMVLHQVNSDGGGPYRCMINADGSASTWNTIQVLTSPPGRNSRNRSGESTDFPLVAAIPPNQECTGTVAGQDNVCLVRCQNDARAGPFGGIVPVQMAGSANVTESRRRLARAVLDSERALARMAKRGLLEDDDEDDELESFELEEERLEASRLGRRFM
ncbi:hypothetical protein SODALDRAFT_328507 [Sodiomyces alkalinus F11]|uniref:CAS1 protein n=1 Tax=Sodiomyces alkalinus (strain CBS 110278 / VKM F-3762 / F11) TaxID=1314773 RepID=A0A3N2PNP3_SODAK|nr:hypothetical protein SODALDRAFT_328507 [Sodiomyces alkalinus F11]ROT36135.1 hypothetical protein SODALDRAFT_328507 [Sodiomyces alkalinus F11]